MGVGISCRGEDENITGLSCLLVTSSQGFEEGVCAVCQPGRVSVSDILCYFPRQTESIPRNGDKCLHPCPWRKQTTVQVFLSVATNYQRCSDFLNVPITVRYL